MGNFYDEIPENTIEWIKKQQMFWVASAPLTGSGHVNVSPKATPNCFHIINPRKVYYEDLTGSGIETISHLREPGNGRITILFHAFEGPPRLVRLFGTGTFHEFGTPEFDEYVPLEGRKPGNRAVIVIDIYKVGTSCGYGIPLYNFQSHRVQLYRWNDSMEIFDRENDAESKSELNKKGIKAWWTVENLRSLDGLPGLRHAHVAQRTPTTFFDRNAKENKTPVPKLGRSNKKRELGFDALPVKLAAAFALGVVVTTVYGRVVQTMA
ncbi:hypothetical protein SERLA73DRAFT_188095 [Serpula lacrymans var. lacrymans S7.3]|uniref:Pyridoxamine 5'-phosphate oxidase putative domain-containing protein n=2 Tax=Serpula lacrymans var. lacrymans TaxID=341189 RepID=F8QAQ7_SERL3|nr:uncharacterized protein SERLADRAFT_478073 [Serpula lacrymans var. lacrymans S7.9]EGN94293.1 hypothetical protein SERLA73DRAFT_188095 [Serpula lacrymans var. lacrymans S7.3]EGO19782.1 hypothetical protein SERLADRAFT_478073 [Serpula lacrymans var. lacrymans S7.9]